jgi:ribosomal protein S18 acetylase RimI-like enzyme
MYPREWEYEVQSAVRQLRPPFRPPCFLLVGSDSDGIAAVSCRTEVAGPGQVHLELMAVANRHRHTAGYMLGDELWEATLDEIVDRAVQAEAGHILVTAHVHPSNKASQALCERHGFGRTGQADSGYDVWSAEIYPDV